MNINEISDKNSITNTQGHFEAKSESSVGKLKNKSSFSFELESSKDQDVANSDDQTEKTEPQNITENVIALNDAKLIQTIQDMAVKDKLSVKHKGINKDDLFLKNNHTLNKDNLHFDISNMTKDDAQFLKLIASKSDVSINSIDTQNSQIQISVNDVNTPVSYKTLDFSKGLYELVDHAYNTQKPVRLSFEGDSSVILKVGTDGKISAHFLSSDKAMEQVLRNNIPELRNKFENEGIPYKEIAYKEQSKRQNKRNQNGG